ncbi:MAG TPA: hypothetical protein VFT22_10950 [Kofleriaceae bacterium]|nr:hypothetical protein [Kofleriaceae bacterium]
MADDDTPAREGPRHTAATEARLEHIAGMMRRLEWVTGESGPALAKQWNLSATRLAHLSAEASKRVRKELMDDQHVGATVGAALDTAIRGAVGERDWKSVAQLAKVYADAAGVSAPQKIDANITGEDSELAGRLLSLIASSEEAEDSGEAEPGGTPPH